MSSQRISEGLTNLFATHAVVFWHDLDGEFSSALDDLQLDGVRLVRMDQSPMLTVKLDIERAADQRWLLYSTLRRGATRGRPPRVARWRMGIRRCLFSHHRLRKK